MAYISTPEGWTAAGTVANAVIVAVLAILNYFYLKSAKSQSEAATAQARQSQRQADAAMESLRVLKSQLDQREKRDTRRAITIMRNMTNTVNFWKQFFPDKWGQMPNDQPQFVPSDWFILFDVVSGMSPELRETAQSLEQSLGNAENQIRRFLGVAPQYRGTNVLSDVPRNLEDATPLLNKLLTALEAHDRSFSIPIP